MVRLGEDRLALNHFENVARIRERFLGLSHPDTIATIKRLAALYERRGMNTEACVLFKKLWYAQWLESGFKVAHFDVIRSLKHNLWAAGLKAEADYLESDMERYFDLAVAP